MEKFDETYNSVIDLLDFLEEFAAEKKIPKKEDINNIKTQIQKTRDTLQKNKEDIKKALGENKSKTSSESDNQIHDEKPDDEARELQAQMMIEKQNEHLRSEAELHRRFEEIKALANKNRALQDDVLNNRADSIKMLKTFESRAKNAERKIQELSRELVRSQELAKKYQIAYDQQVAGPGSVAALRSEAATAVNDNRQLQLQSKLIENETLRLEITRLTDDNRKLMWDCKKAEEEMNKHKHMYYTSEAARQDLAKRLSRRKDEKEKLQATLNRQSTQFVQKKKELKRLEEELRWKMINSKPSWQGDQGSLPKQIYVPKRITSPRPMSALTPPS